ncbi:MAG: ATP-binding protein [Ferruginibacter sp.]
MKIKKLIYYITAIFIVGTMILIGMQYITSKNVNELISGNENLLNEFRLSNQLTTLQKDMLVFDNKLKSAIITSDTIKIRDFSAGLEKIENDITVLENASSNDSVQKSIDELNNLVHQKLEFSNDVVDSFNISGKVAAEKLFVTDRGTKLSQDIFLTAQKIDKSRQLILEQTTEAIDKSGQLAFRWGVIMIGAVLILFTVIFWFIITRMKKQYDLNNQLNESEKKIKEIVRVKENFLANMSHEIRTPMNAILGYTNLLQRKELDHESKLHLSTIQKSGENLLSIINDILDISKIEAGMMRIEETPFSVRGLLHSLEVMFKNKIEEKRLFLKTNVAENVQDTLSGDATKLTQVLVNLVGNAIKFTERGTVTIHVSQKIINTNNIDLVFIIKDTGIGIEKEKLQTIFERFIQAEETTTRKFGGTGLGLSIVKNIVEIQKGTIMAESEPGVGTSVTFNIPYKILNSTVLTNRDINIIPVKPFKTNLLVLLVEDNIINQGLITHLFKEWHVEHKIAGNGKEAIVMLLDQHFDLVLMDIQMPEMDGYAATHEIRQQLKMDIPIVAMTAHAMAGEREKCLSYGMNDHISKPIREIELYQLISQFVNLKKSHDQKNGVNNNFSVINLGYMQEISNGNKEYEQVVTAQFIEMIPVEIVLLQKAFEANDVKEIKQVAHNMKTTVSVMGLNRLIDVHLDAIENNPSSGSQLEQHLNTVSFICEKALEEAKLFLLSLNKNDQSV